MKKDKIFYKIIGYAIAVSCVITLLFGSIWLAFKAVSAFINIF